MERALPTGRRGQFLAVLLALILALLVLALLWLGVAQPLRGWYADRAERLAQQRDRYQHMVVIARSLPELRQRVRAAATVEPGANPPANALLEGDSDAIAGAALQEHVQDMATRLGATLTSTETLPAEPVQALRRIGLRISLSAPWPVLVELLHSIAQARPRMVVDDLQVQGSHLLARSAVTLLEGSFVVYAFRAAAPPKGTP